MPQKPPQGRGSGGRVTPSAKTKGSTPDAGAKGDPSTRPKARVQQPTARSKPSKSARAAAKEPASKASSTASAKSGTSRTTPKSTKTKAKVPEPEPVKGWRSLLASPDPDDVAPKDRPRPWWGMGDMALWFLISQIAGGVAYTVATIVGGYSTYWPIGPGSTAGEVVGRTGAGQAPSVTQTLLDMPLAVTQLIQIPLWIGFLGGPLYVSWRKGTSLKEDFGFTMKPKDIPLGLAIGGVAQVVLLWIVYKLLFIFIGEQDVSASARSLVDKATSPALTVLLVLGVAIAAPVFEELFFRGLSQRAIAKRFGPTWAIFGSALFFALAHFQTLQFPGLFIFGLLLGWLANRYGRLGPSIWTHIGFNLVAAVLLLRGT